MGITIMYTLYILQCRGKSRSLCFIRLSTFLEAVLIIIMFHVNGKFKLLLVSGLNDLGRNIFMQ
jgi:hypothetical protein